MSLKYKKIILSLLFFSVASLIILPTLNNVNSEVLAVTLGPNSSLSAVNDISYGVGPWINPQNAAIISGNDSDDNSYATVSLDGRNGPETSTYLKATGFNFNVPAGATIAGIAVDIVKKANSSVTGRGIIDNSVRIFNNGSLVGVEKANSALWPLTDTNFTYGSSTDNWGTNLSSSEVNNSNFGVVLAAGVTDRDVIASVDSIKMTVYYDYATPNISNISPNSKVVGDPSFTLTVSGSNFQSGAIIRWNGSARTTNSSGAPSQLTATIPASDLTNAGTNQVTVLNPTGQVSSAFNFTVNNAIPSITTISPSSVLRASTSDLLLTINGNNFAPGVTVKWNNSPVAWSVTFVNTNQLTVTIPSSSIYYADLHNISVVNPTPGGGDSASTIFTVNNDQPTTIGLSQTSAIVGSAGFNITVNGTGFFTQGSSEGCTFNCVPSSKSIVYFNGVALNTTFNSATQLTANIPASLLTTLGNYPIEVVNPAPVAGSGVSNAQTFSVNNIVPTTLSPLVPDNISTNANNFLLTVNGSNFATGATINWNGTPVPITNYINSTQLTTTIPSSYVTTAGTVNITVTNPQSGGVASNAQVFTINNLVPIINSLSPFETTINGPQFTITVNGNRFIDGPNGSRVKFNGQVRETTFISNGQLTAVIPASDLLVSGLFSVTVNNPAPGGGDAIPKDFTVNSLTPTLTGISPDSKPVGSSTFTITVDGTNFINSSGGIPNSGSLIYFGNTPLASTTFVSSTRLTAQVDSSLLASGAYVPITVVNPEPVVGNGLSNSISFSVLNPTPTITSFNPTSGVFNTPITLTINGTGFVDEIPGVAGSGSIVKFAAQERETIFVSSTELTVVLLASDFQQAGTYNITVHNPAPTTGSGIASSPFSINNPSPSISGLSPIGASRGSQGFTLTINGSNFVDDSVVNWNGVARTTDFISPTQLTAIINTNDLTTSGSYNITVTNPTPGGGTSTPVAFLVNDPPPQNVITRVQSKSISFGSSGSFGGGGGGSTSASLTWDYFTTSGSLLVATVVASNTDENVNYINISAPAGWSTASIRNLNDLTGIEGSNVVVGIFYKANSPSQANTGDFTGSGSGLDMVVMGAEYSGIAPALVLDAVADNAGLNEGIIDTGTTVETDQTNELWIGVLGNNGDGGTFNNPTNGFSIVESDTTRVNGSFIERIVSEVGIANSSSNIAAADQWAGAMATFRGKTSTPIITSINPDKKTRFSNGFNLTISGFNFKPESIVRFNGQDKTTTYLSSSKTIRAFIPATDLETAGTFKISVNNPVEGGGVSNEVDFTVENPFPSIDFTTPEFALVGTPGLTVEIDGNNDYVPESVANWNGSPRQTTVISRDLLQIELLPSDLLVSSINYITVTNPGPPGGGTSLTVIQGLEGDIEVGMFLVVNPAPVISYLDPAEVLASNNPFTISIFGLNFVQGADVFFDDERVGSEYTTFVSENQIDVIIDPDAPGQRWAPNIIGLYEIYVENPGITANSNGTCCGDGHSNVVNFTVTGPVPTITSITPDSSAAGITDLQITVDGTNFFDIIDGIPNSGSLVYWFNTQLNDNEVLVTGSGGPVPTTFVSDTQLIATIPPEVITNNGEYRVIVVNPAPGGGVSNYVPFIAGGSPIPKLDDKEPIDPRWANLNSPDILLTVNGKDDSFVSNSEVRWNGSPLFTEYISPNQLVATIPAANMTTAGIYDITVFNPPPGGGSTPPIKFTIYNPPPRILDLSPRFVPVGNPAFTMTITGENFLPSSYVDFDGLGGTVISQSATQFTALIPSTKLYSGNVYTIRVITPGPGGGIYPVPFTVVNPLPSTNNINPNTALAGTENITVNITGNNFVPPSPLSMSGSSNLGSSVYFGEYCRLTQTNLTDCQAVGGEWIGGICELTDTTQEQCTLNSGNWLKRTALSTTYISPTQLTAQLSLVENFVIGDYPITVSNSIDTVSLEGIGCIFGCSDNDNDGFAGSEDNCPLWWNPGQEDADSDGHGDACDGIFDLDNDVDGIENSIDNCVETFNPGQEDIDQDGRGDACDSTISTISIGGGDSNQQLFTVTGNPFPVINDISPTFVNAGSNSITLTINGSGFIDIVSGIPYSGSVIYLNDAVLPTTFVSPTQLTAYIDSSYLITGNNYEIVIVNPAPGGGISGTVNFEVKGNPIPILENISPKSAIAGSSSFIMTLDGNEFIAPIEGVPNSGSLVYFNNIAVPTSYVSATRLSAQISESHIINTGTYSVKVVNPAPGGGISDTKSFTVFLAPPPPPLGAITRIQNANGGFTSSGLIGGGGVATLNWYSPTAPTDLLVIGIVATNKQTDPITITPPEGWRLAVSRWLNSKDTSGSEWTNIVSAIFYYENAPSQIDSGDFIINGSAQQVSIMGAEYSGIATESALDRIARNSGCAFAGVSGCYYKSGISTKEDSGTTNPTIQANEVWVALLGNNGNGATYHSPTKGFTIIETNTLSENGAYLDKIVDYNSAANTTATVTSGGEQYTGVTATFRGADPGEPNPSPNISGIYPTWVAIGSPSFAMRVTGFNFKTDSVVNINDTPLVTSYVSDVEILAYVPSIYLTELTRHKITVVNTLPSGKFSESNARALIIYDPTVPGGGTGSGGGGTGDFGEGSGGSGSGPAGGSGGAGESGSSGSSGSSGTAGPSSSSSSTGNATGAASATSGGSGSGVSGGQQTTSGGSSSSGTSGSSTIGGSSGGPSGSSASTTTGGSGSSSSSSGTSSGTSGSGSSDGLGDTGSLPPPPPGGYEYKTCLGLTCTTLTSPLQEPSDCNVDADCGVGGGYLYEDCYLNSCQTFTSPEPKTGDCSSCGMPQDTTSSSSGSDTTSSSSGSASSSGSDSSGTSSSGSGATGDTAGTSGSGTATGGPGYMYNSCYQNKCQVFVSSTPRASSCTADAECVAPPGGFDYSACYFNQCKAFKSPTPKTSTCTNNNDCLLPYPTYSYNSCSSDNSCKNFVSLYPLASTCQDSTDCGTVGLVTRLQHSNASFFGTNTAKITWPTPTQDGSLLVVGTVITTRRNTPPTFTVPTGWKQGPSKIVPLNDGLFTHLVTAIFYRDNAPSELRTGEFRINGNNQKWAIMGAEYIGAYTLDKSASSNGTGLEEKTGTTTQTSQQNELWVGIVGNNNFGGSYSNTLNGFTLTEANTTQVNGAYLDKIVSKAGIASSGATISTAGSQWAGVMATFGTVPPSYAVNLYKPAGFVQCAPGSTNCPPHYGTCRDDIKACTLKSCLLLSTFEGPFNLYSCPQSDCDDVQHCEGSLTINKVLDGVTKTKIQYGPSERFAYVVSGYPPVENPYVIVDTGQEGNNNITPENPFDPKDPDFAHGQTKVRLYKGTYVVSEILNDEDWKGEALYCSNSLFSAQDPDALRSPTVKATITPFRTTQCYFRNTYIATGTLRIITQSDFDGDFKFNVFHGNESGRFVNIKTNGGEGESQVDLLVDDEASNDTVLQEFTAAGLYKSYTLVQEIPDGWSFDEVECKNEAGEVVGDYEPVGTNVPYYTYENKLRYYNGIYGAAVANLPIEAHKTVTCTFKNHRKLPTLEIISNLFGSQENIDKIKNSNADSRPIFSYRLAQGINANSYYPSPYFGQLQINKFPVTGSTTDLAPKPSDKTDPWAWGSAEISVNPGMYYVEQTSPPGWIPESVSCVQVYETGQESSGEFTTFATPGDRIFANNDGYVFNECTPGSTTTDCCLIQSSKTYDNKSGAKVDYGNPEYCSNNVLGNQQFNISLPANNGMFQIPVIAGGRTICIFNNREPIPGGEDNRGDGGEFENPIKGTNPEAVDQ